MSMISENAFGKISRTPRRRVSIRRDDADFIVAFQPDDVVIFRHNKASALRKLCCSLRWEIDSDTIADPSDPASW